MYILKRIRKPSLLRDEAKADQKEGYQKLRNVGTRILDYPTAVLLGMRLFYVHHLGDVLCIFKCEAVAYLLWWYYLMLCCMYKEEASGETVAPAAQGSVLARDNDDKVFVSRDVP
jgi:hypothetical protein